MTKKARRGTDPRQNGMLRAERPADASRDGEGGSSEHDSPATGDRPEARDLPDDGARRPGPPADQATAGEGPASGHAAGGNEASGNGGGASTSGGVGVDGGEPTDVNGTAAAGPPVGKRGRKARRPKNERAGGEVRQPTNEGPGDGAKQDNERAGDPAPGADGEAADGTGGAAKQRKRAKRRTPLWTKLALTFGIILILVSGGTIAASKFLIDQATSSITQTSLIGTEAAAPPPTGPSAKKVDGPINLLLVGIDVRPGWDAGARSDTIMIVHIPATHDQAYLVSIPRDWRVRIPANPETHYRGGMDKINAAFAFGYQGGGTEVQKRARGFSLLSRTLHNATGITFNGAALIDFAGFEAVVKELGGVNMCVDQRATSIHLAYDRNGKLVPIQFNDRTHRVYDIPPGGHVVVHEKGCRPMSAALALDYARIRYGLPKTDYDRQRHQQQLIKAIVDKATSAGVITNPGKLNRVVKAAGKAFILDTRGVPITDYLFTLKGVTANDMVVLRTNNGNFHGEKIGGVDYELMSDESLDMLHAVRDAKLPQFVTAHPDVRAPKNG